VIRVTVPSAADIPAGLSAVGVPIHATADGPAAAVDPGTLRGVALPESLDPAWCERQGFTAKVGQTLVLRSVAAAGTGGDPDPDLVLVGIGDADTYAGDRGLESLRRASAAFVRAVGRGPVARLVVTPPAGRGLDDAAASAAEGGALAAYRYDRFRSGETPSGLAELALTGSPQADPGALSDGAVRGARVAESVALARDLINEPAGSLGPQRFAEVVVERFASTPGVTVEVWDEHRIAEEHLGGLLGVAAGSVRPPRLVHIEYRPADPWEFDGHVPRLAIVGKGITFDSGGLSLKTAGGMETMKTDMAGAAAVVAAVDAAAALGARIALSAWTPLTENMPSGSATRPGDVLTARNGKTIEVLNTDAEGRLVLADALSLAVEAGPDAIVDLATLTGAAVVALGKEIAGLLGNDDELRAEVQAAGERAGEPSWPLPLPDDYRVHIESEVADMRNVGRSGQAGTIAAALLLREFVGDVPWAHLDIAGPSRAEEARGYVTKGATGFGARTLVALVTSEAFARSLAARAST